MESEGVPSGADKDQDEFVARTYDRGTLIIGSMKYDKEAGHYVFVSTPNKGIDFEYLVNENFSWKTFESDDDFKNAVRFFGSYIGRYKSDGEYFVISLEEIVTDEAKFSEISNLDILIRSSSKKKKIKRISCDLLNSVYYFVKQTKHEVCYCYPQRMA